MSERLFIITVRAHALYLQIKSIKWCAAAAAAVRFGRIARIAELRNRVCAQLGDAISLTLTISLKTFNDK